MAETKFLVANPNRHRSSLKRKLIGILRLFGLDVARAIESVRWLPRYFRDYWIFRRLSSADHASFPIGRLLPMLGDHLKAAGVASGHYFYQDLYVARRIFELSPERHVDIGSRIDGFVAHVAAFRPIEVVDIRPLTTAAKNITFVRADLQDRQAANLIGKADSVSCLNVVEHFGLGRYGDPLQADGHVIGIRNIAKLVQDGGLYYLSVPIGPQRVEFNAHRVFAAQTIPNLLAGEFDLEGFSFVDDADEFHENVAFTVADASLHFGCYLGCGIYELRRVSSGRQP